MKTNPSSPLLRRWLLPVGILGLALVTLAIWLTFNGGANRAGVPQLQIDRRVVDFGEVPIGQQVSATITLTNSGQKALRIQKAPYIEVLEGC